ncbi:MAG: N5-glutamine methyltransferase family protein [Ilumatobacteraceae bacterium]
MNEVRPGEMVTFLGVELETTADVLVPREETELLGRTAIGLLPPPTGEPVLVIDVCCGAGNLAAAIAVARPDVRVEATDLTDECVGLTRRNVDRLGLADRIGVHQGDLFEGLQTLGLEGRVDLVVCNPPYISTGKLDSESAHLLADQPREAFDAGPYGIGIHRRVARETPTLLRAGGWLAMEIGVGQYDQLAQLIDRSRRYDNTEVSRDRDGEPRVIAARRAAD